MENVKLSQTKRVGNPKWIHEPTNIDIYYVLGNGSGSSKASLYIHHKDLNVYDLTGKESDKKQNNKEVYLKPVTISSYTEVFEAYMAQISLLYELGFSPVEIITKIWTSERGSKNTELEVDTLKTMFKEVTMELKTVTEKMDLICKEMEML